MSESRACQGRQGEQRESCGLQSHWIEQRRSLIALCPRRSLLSLFRMAFTDAKVGSGSSGPGEIPSSVDWASSLYCVLHIAWSVESLVTRGTGDREQKANPTHMSGCTAPFPLPLSWPSVGIPNLLKLTFKVPGPPKPFPGQTTPFDGSFCSF